MMFTASWSKVLAPLVLACSLFSTQASAAVLLESNPNTIDPVGQQSDAGTPVPYTENTTLAKATITSFTWWGYYLSGTGPGADDFSLNGFNLGNGGGAVVASLSGGIDLYQYVVDLTGSPIMHGGGALALTLVNNSDSVEWYWQGASTEDGPRAFVLEGTFDATQAPEPASLLLLGLGLAGLGFSSRRKQAS